MRPVIVQAPPKSERRQKSVDVFVGAVAKPVNQEGLVRWAEPICPIEAGLVREQGAYLIQRLGQIALAAGARVASKGCQPNFFIIATVEPEKLAREWEHRNPDAFKGRPAAIERFQKTDRPVRVWYNWTFEGATETGETSSAGLPGALAQAPAITFTEDSRLTFNAPRSLDSVIVVVDGRQLSGVKTAALADYVAMAGLTWLDLDADLSSAPTILNLFKPPGADGQRPTGLSAWDSDFLHALYHTTQADVRQKSQIEARMMKQGGR